MAHLHTLGALDGISELATLQWRPAAELRALHDERLAALVRHAAGHVPFYGERLRRAGVVDGDAQVRLDRFTAVPLLDKRTIRAHFDELTSDDLARRRWCAATSGGSTGRPVKILRDHTAGADLAVFSLFNTWAGQRPGARHALFWGLSRGIPEHRSFRARLGGWLGRWLNSFIVLDSYSVTPAQLRAHVARYNAWRPAYLQGYADFLYYLARFVEREGLTIHQPGSITCTATPLYSHMRETIERVFGAPVFDRYGSGEVGLVAAQCERRSGLHVSVPTHHVEILRADGSPAEPGEVGEIVVTPLLELAMPLVRYRTEDLGAWEPETCRCGRSWPMISRLDGRAIDVFATRDGRLVSGGLFIKLVDAVNFAHGDPVDRYQIVQEDRDRVTIHLVPRSGDPATLPPAMLEELRAGVTGTLGGQAQASFEFPSAIEAAPSGKFRFAISRVPRSETDSSDLFQV